MKRLLIALLLVASCKEVEHHRWRVTNARVVQIAGIVDAYHHRHHEFPRSRETSVALVPALDVRALPTRDGWGYDIRYMSSGKHYLLWSLGADGKPQHLEGGGEYEGYDGDFVIYDGAVWQGPAGHF